MVKEVVLKVTGMSCAGCQANVERALKGVKGVSAVSIDRKAGIAVVAFDPGLADEKELVKAVSKAGYGASL